MKVDEPQTFVWPVCQAKLSSLYEGAILRPDGKVCIRGVETFDSLEDYEAHVAEDAGTLDGVASVLSTIMKQKWSREDANANLS